MKSATFKNFQAGIVDDPSIEDQGGFEFASGMDIFSEPGVLKASPAMKASTLEAGVGALAGTPTWFVATSDATLNRVYLSAGAKILHTNDNPPFSRGNEWDLFITNGNGANVGMGAWNNYLMYASASKLGRVPIHTAGSKDDNFATIETDLYFHPMTAQGGSFKIGAGRYIVNVDESFTVTLTALKLMNGYRIKAVIEAYNQLLMATYFRTASNSSDDTFESSVFGWKGTVLSSGSALPDSRFPLKLRGMHALIYDGLNVYAFPDKEGDIYVFDGARFVPYRKLYPPSLNGTLQVRPSAVSTYLDTIVFGGDTNYSPGIYQMKGGAICQAFVPAQTTPGTTEAAAFEIGMVGAAWDRMFIGYYKIATGSYHIEYTDSANKQNNAMVRTLWHRMGTDKFKRWGGIKLNLKPMAANTVVTVAYRTARDASFTSAPYTITSSNQDKPLFFAVQPRSHEIQFRFTYTTSSNNTPELLSYDPIFNILNTHR